MTDVRAATPADLDAIFEMVKGLAAYHGDTAAITRGQLGDAFFGAAPMATALIASIEKTPVGYAGLTPTLVLHEGTVRLDIHHLFVHAPYRDKGVGTALIKAAKAHAIETGAVRLTIGTDEHNTATIAKYRHMEILSEKAIGGPRFDIDLD